LRNWSIPVAIAAVVVLSSSLVMLMVDEGPDRLSTAPGGPIITPQSQSATSMTELPRSTVPASPPPKASMGSTPADADGRVSDRNEVRKQGGAATPSPAVGASSGERRLEESLSGTAGRVGEPESTSSATLRPAPGVQRSPYQMGTKSRGNLSTPGRGVGLQGSTGLVAGSDRKGVPTEENRAPSVAKEASPHGREGMGRSSTETASPLVGPQKSEHKISSSVLSLIRKYESQPPAKWIEKIQELRRQGHSADASDLFSEFRKRYPTYPVPPERSP